MTNEIQQYVRGQLQTYMVTNATQLGLCEVKYSRELLLFNFLPHRNFIIFIKVNHFKHFPRDQNLPETAFTEK